MEDSRQTGELIADVRNLVTVVQKYNGQNAKNNEDIVELRIAHGHMLEQIINIQEEYKNSQEFHEKQLVVMEKLITSNRKVRTMMWVTSTVGSIVVALIVFIPKIAPSWSPFGDSLKVNDVKVLIEENTLSKEDITRIVDDVLKDYQAEIIK
jgi:hypothetical protein